MPPQDDGQLQRIETLTHSLLVAARKGEWDQAIQLEAERRPLIEAYFSNLSTDEKAGLQSSIRKILDADREIMELGRERHQLLGESLRDLNKGRQAMDAYSSSSR